jgi:hypothetical protein
MDNLKELISQHKKERELLIEKLKDYCKDRTIPLEERWELFIESDLGEIDNYYHEPDGINWNKYTLYDDFNCDKYATIDVKGMLKTCKKVLVDDENFTFDEVVFKEYFLNKFLKGFINDW